MAVFDPNVFDTKDVDVDLPDIDQLSAFPDTMLVDIAANVAIFPYPWRKVAAEILVQRINPGSYFPKGNAGPSAQVRKEIATRAAYDTLFALLMTEMGYQ